MAERRRPRAARAAAPILALAAALAALVPLAGGREIVVGQPLAETPGPPLASGLRLAQDFRAPPGGLWALDLQLASYARRAEGELRLSLLGPDGARLAHWRLPAAELVDNAWHRFHLAAPLDRGAGARFSLVLERPQAGGRPLTAWTSGGDAYPEGALTVDGRPSGGDLAFRARFRPGWQAGAAWVLASAGLPPQATLGLLALLFASALGFLYTYAPR